MAGDHFRSLGSRSDLTRSSLDLQRKTSLLVCGPQTGPVTGESTEEAGSTKCCTRAAGKTGCRKMPGCGTGILRSSLRCTEEEWGMASSHRPKPSEQVFGCTTLQNGNGTVNTSSTAARRICGPVRSTRRIFSHSHKTKISKVPKILSHGNSVQISSPLLRTSHSTKSIHNGDAVCSQICTKTRHDATCLPRRLVTQKSVTRSLARSTKKVTRPSRQVRDSSQLFKISSNSQTNFCLPRSKVRPSKSVSFSDSRSSVKGQSLDRVLPHSDRCASKSPVVISRSTQSSRRPSSTRKAECQTSTVVSKMLLPSSCGSFIQEDPSEGSFLQMSPILEESGVSISRKPSTSTSGGSVCVHRCQSDRLGCSAEQSVSCRSLESTRLRTSFQHSGNDGHDKRSSKFPKSCKSQGCNVSLRQPYGGFSCAETRRHSLLDSVYQNSPTVSVSRKIRSNTQSSMDAWKGSHRSRLSKQTTPGNGSGMVASGCSFSQAAVSVSRDENRSLCNLCQSETSSICKSQSRAKGHGSGCVFYLLGRFDSLCLPSNKAITSSSTQDPVRSRLHSTDSPSLARPSMVSNNSQSTNRLSEEASLPPETSVSEERENVPFQPSDATPSRLAIIKRSLQEKGFSEKVSARAALANRESTRSIYDSRFSKFAEWCESRERPLAEVTIQEIADFLLELFEKGLLINTIKGYRSAISSAMGLFEGATVGSHPDISKLISGFEVQRPVTRSYFPCWDLNVVLKALMKAPFEPPSFDTVQDRKFTTWKTVFLVSLASAKRASEIHAISRSKRDLIFLKDGVQLRAIPGFLGKTQSASCDAKPYTIADHQQFVGRDTVDRLLCPKRMLKYYLQFTGGFKVKSRMFLKCSGEGEVKKATVSSWLKSVISYAYEHSEEELQGSVSGHDVRRMSTSCSFAAGTRLQDILEAAEWKQTTTFTCHYLKDIEPQPDGMYRLGAVLAGSRSNV